MAMDLQRLRIYVNLNFIQLEIVIQVLKVESIKKKIESEIASRTEQDVRNDFNSICYFGHE